MKQTTLSQPKHPVVVQMEHVHGDLQVVGWERDEITAKTDGDQVELGAQNGAVKLACDGDAILYLPRDASLEVGKIDGDGDIRALSGSLTIRNVSGDLQLRNVGPANIEKVGSDLSLRVCEGDFKAGTIGADASLREVRGSIHITSVGADLYVRELTGNLEAVVGADAVLYIQPAPEASYDVTSGADILLRLPGSPDAQFQLASGTPDGIRVDLGEAASTVTGSHYELSLGSGSAKFRLTAGADLVVTSRAREWESAAEFDRASRDFPGPGWSPLPPDFGERINRTVAAATRRAQLKTDAAMRRAEEKLRAAEHRSRHMGVSMGRWSASSERQSSPPPPPSEPVSDEERLSILRMLQEKKITREEAEKLLAALEGK
jgi:SHOCT-like protein